MNHLTLFRREKESVGRKIRMLLAFKDNSNDILYSSQQEIKAVVRSYTLMHNEELNSTYLNTKVTKHTHVDTLVHVSVTKSRNTHT